LPIYAILGKRRYAVNISIPDDKIKIVNEEGEEVTPGEVGEVIIR
jgi:non-ribosomal peptide synthetase component E (peptide arylation enzyme)